MRAKGKLATAGLLVALVLVCIVNVILAIQQVPGVIRIITATQPAPEDQCDRSCRLAREIYEMCGDEVGDQARFLSSLDDFVKDPLILLVIGENPQFYKDTAQVFCQIGSVVWGKER